MSIELDDAKTILKAAGLKRGRKKRGQNGLARADFYIHMGKLKGIVVKRNVLVGGWSVTLPNGTTTRLDCDSDMISYVKGY